MPESLADYEPQSGWALLTVAGVRLDRRPNPHLSFGFGPHLCLGASHARLIVRSLLQALADRVMNIAVLETKTHIEHEACYDRADGFETLKVSFTPR